MRSLRHFFALPMQALTVLLFLMMSCLHATAQDDLLDLIADTSTGNEHLIGTFKSTKLINLQTNETIGKKTLDVRISHLFGAMGKESGGNVHNLYGLDRSDDIRLGLHYGITDRIMAGISRSKRWENLEGLLKIALLRQTLNNRVPLSVTVFTNLTWSARRSEFFTHPLHRLTYCSQLILARKFGSRLSVMAVPSFLHRNVVFSGEKHNTYSMGGGFRFRFSPSTSIIADYSHTFNANDQFFRNEDVIGAGFEIETGGHVFTIMFSNAPGLLENDFLVNTRDTWGNGGARLSFIISRVFKMEKKKRTENEN